MATIKQIEHRLKQSRGRLQRLSSKKLELGEKLSSAKDETTRARVEGQLAKNEAEAQDTQKTLDRLEEELADAKDPAKDLASKGRSSAQLMAPDRFKQLEARLEDMHRFEKQLELAQRSNLDRFKQIQLQIRDLSKLTDRLLMVESQLRELKLGNRASSKADSHHDDVFDEEDASNITPVSRPQSATTSAVGEPLNVEMDAHWPWPVSMSRFLTGWLKGRKWWGHEDWVGLVRQLSIQEFSNFATPEFHAKIGAYLEQHRGR